MTRRGGSEGTSGAVVQESNREAALAALEEARASRPSPGSEGRLPRPPAEIDLRSLSLIRADLARIDLSGFDLSDCDLSNADLSGARLAGCDLRNTLLFGAQLTDAELLGAQLDGADLTEANLERAGFSNTTAVEASFFNVKATKAVFGVADLTRADFRASNLEDARMKQANLQGTMFDRAQMRGADLTSSTVNEASFRDADLEDTKLRDVSGYASADWIGADLRRVDFNGAWLLRRHALDENYLHEFRTQSTRHEWLYRVWWVTSDCGRSLLRWTVWTAIIALLYAFAYTQVDIEWGNNQTPFSPVYYSVVTFTTLGYGDVLPGSVTAQVLALTEVVLGYFSLGGMMSILSDKIARRSG